MLSSRIIHCPLHLVANFVMMKAKKRSGSVKNEEYEVEDIVAHKKEGRLDYFRVRWKGFDECDDTWEVEANLAHAPMFHAKMQELRNETEQKIADREAEAQAQAHAKKRRRPEESDPSRPCEEESPTDVVEREFRFYPTGTKVPKHHLPDENALGDRLSIVRFRRADDESDDEKKNKEEGQHIQVVYSIDGVYSYTIPFDAARRYCCQRLLSYLVSRTQFKSATPRASQERDAKAPSCARNGNPQCSGEGSVADNSSEQLEFKGCGACEAGETANASTTNSRKGSVSLPPVKLHKENAAVVNTEHGATAQTPAEPQLVAAS